MAQQNGQLRVWEDALELLSNEYLQNQFKLNYESNKNTINPKQDNSKPATKRKDPYIGRKAEDVNSPFYGTNIRLY